MGFSVCHAIDQSITICGSVNGIDLAVTAVYGSNEGIARRRLWEHLKLLEGLVGQLPWAVGGNYNERDLPATQVIHQKPKTTLDEITKELCPVLSIQQLYRISTMYWDDKYGTNSVSSDVIAKMRVMMTEDSNNAVSSSFLLDDDSSIPFTVDYISKSLQQVDIADVEPPSLIRGNSGFGFLLPRSD
ncbi:myosin-17-like [Hibiscus syriacus]|uniref:myosin-17-like n=1 Tax=Hibiscus syriacus TaxID=106335 RepID=UPI001921F367|nr:myosin-17-like [Hibiscus syriacus]